MSSRGLPAAAPHRRRRARPSASRKLPETALLRLQTPEVVHDVPDLRLGHLALVALHVKLRAGAIADDDEDLAVAVAAIPFGVGQIGRVSPFRRHRTVAFGIRAVTEAAVFLEGGLTRLDRLRR